MGQEVSCFRCNRLGECRDATLEMLQEGEGCGSFDPAPRAVVRARTRAQDVAGVWALKEMLIKNPPKKKLTRR